MFSQPRVWFTLLRIFVLLGLLLITPSTPHVSADQVIVPSSTPDPFAAAMASCNLTSPSTPFKASNFPSSPNVNNPLLSYAPGTELILEGRINVNGQRVDHQVILIVTDLTKVVHGVHTVVLWDRDFNMGVLTESELAFHAQDNSGNVWNLGEYPAQYSGGAFTNAPDTWFEGLSGGQAGTIIPGNPQVGKPLFLQAYAPNIIWDCGQVAAVGQHVCDPVGCYDNVLVVDENSNGETGVQQKFYAPGVGNFQIGATNNDPQGETLVLTETIHLDRQACIVARQAALALEDQAYNKDTSQTVYDQTAPMEQTGFCETLVSTPTPTPETPTPQTPTPETPTPQTPTAEPTSSRSLIDTSVYLPLVAYGLPPTATPTLVPTVSPTPRPTVPPAVYDGCKSDPDPAGAPETPMRIVGVDKVAEVVTLENVSDRTISLEDWNLCSLNTNEDHDQIFGTIAPGQTRSFPNVGKPNVWDDNQRNDAALYNAGGFLVSYWVDQ